MFGKILGFFTLASFAAAIMNYIVKYFLKNYREKIKASEGLNKFFDFCINLFVKKHKMWGAFAVIGALSHGLLQYSKFGRLNVPGAIAVGLMLIQGILGFSMTKVDADKRKTLKTFHRIVPVLMLIPIIYHLILVG
ncbi:MAG: hypothetical protein SPI59_05610 [Finegoldia sp.]|nr:hypothetical protein [Finegoldia sp.]